MLSIRKLRKNKRNRSVSRYKQRGVVRRRARGPWCGRTGRKLSVQCTCTPPPPSSMSADACKQCSRPCSPPVPPHHAFSGQLDNLGPVQFVSAGSDTDPLPRRLCCALALAPGRLSLLFTSPSRCTLTCARLSLLTESKHMHPQIFGNVIKNVTFVTQFRAFLTLNQHHNQIMFII